MQSLNYSREKTEMRLKTYLESSLRRSMSSLHVIIFFPNSYSLKVLRVEKVLIISSFKSVTGWNKSEKPTAVPVLNNNNVRTEIKVDIQVRCLMIFISNLYHKEGTCSTGLTWHDFFSFKNGIMGGCTYVFCALSRPKQWTETYNRELSLVSYPFLSINYEKSFKNC